MSYLGLDHATRMAGFEATVRGWVGTPSALPGVAAARAFPNEAGQSVPRAALTIDPAVAGLTAAELCRRLWDGDPAIAVEPRDEGGLFLTPDCLEPGEEALVEGRICALLADAGRRMAGAR